MTARKHAARRTSSDDLALTVPGRLAALLLDSPEFARSGWSDVHAFVLANTFDNGFTHLLGGLIVASLVGVVGAVVGTGQTQTRPAGQGSAPAREA